MSCTHTGFVFPCPALLPAHAHSHKQKQTDTHIETEPQTYTHTRAPLAPSVALRTPSSCQLKDRNRDISSTVRSRSRP